MAVSQASSRLEMLQARFQQKQMQEKEQKLLQLYDQQQQRAYQVVQRGSAGSTTSVSQQHSVTKTTTSTHTTSTTQGGKVRQMFDERRQTTVKGIDRSYPLEPLDNKSKRQIVASNGNVPSKPNQQGNVTRQVVTVRRTARSDVNSNVNGGKPIVSYHEEVSHESFGNDNEFGNENRNNKYHDENDQSTNQNGVHIEEILDDDTIGRNRMLAKIHLMEYDKNLKHRINNDLDNEQFPDDLMVDVPDKLPRKPVTKKLSQAEARLERFKNANAKRNTSDITTTNRPELRKRSEPMFASSKTNSRNTTIKSKTTENVKVRPSAKERPPMVDTIQSQEQVARKISTGKTTEPVKANRTPTKIVKPAAVQTETPAPVRPVEITVPKPVQTVKPATKSSEPSPRVQKSPSPDPAGRKTKNFTTKPVTRRSFPTSPSKSPDSAKRHGSANAKSPEPRAPRVSSQGAPRNHEPVTANEIRTTSKGSHQTKVIGNSDSETPSKFVQEIDDTKSSTISRTILKKEIKASVDDSDGDSKEKEPEQSQESMTRKYSTERESTPQNQRQRSPTGSPSPRPPSALSTASSTTSSTRGAVSGDSQARRMATKAAKTPTRSGGTISKARPSGPPSARSGPAALNSESLTPCKICGRRFAQDRVTLHEKICAKTGQKKRKQFDAGLHRVQGTELEAFVKKGGPPGRQAEQRAKAKKPEAKAKSNWRRKHEDFINAIRSAKQVQAHLAAGGKLSDLPPPPASDTSDYIQCPHCSRKFNQGAAERHIPKCATMMHNKPNPRAPPKPKR